MSNSAPQATVGRTVDWGFAATVGARLARPGPPASSYTRTQVIEELAAASRAAELPVREVTGLNEGAAVMEARIVDRPEWIRAATRSMSTMTGGTERPDGFLTGHLTGAQTGAVLAFVSAGILGQYDPFGQAGGQERRGYLPAEGEGADSGDTPQGELLLVWPNVIAVERVLRVTPSDFRLWVCLHEVTHRVQFRANPWLTEHMSSSLAVLTDDTGDGVTDVVGRLAEFVRNRNAPADPNNTGVLGLVRAVQSDAQRRALDQLLVLGTLLEGHADHVMDAVGPAVVPSVETIRRRFNERRERQQPPLQRIMRALLGIDAKISQYTRGKAFVDAVVGKVGMERFNTVWSGPETLPLPAEIDEPQRWIDRVL
ncbi:zinc-dependent metalloprotease [Mycolicibacterium sp. F2034L]|uniref:zinc-dependent metalloprotease n=1 Tax=Mycolicibacterium sp. F2034L TaxID=2926422 RepID=UPI001FF1931B|nr:zinc-dependent metalloprotease [Mycolicibacterium sp. F2034L]MCK0176922.1 zinc-dependent metalloprotease [Mycolicibacterium sp. F2034L]